MNSDLKILAVDDDKVSQKMIGRALANEAFSVSYADNGVDGLQKAQDDLPDLIILDVEMPGMNGYEVCEKLRSTDNTRCIPVVFLSSHSTLRERMQGYEAGADDYLVKPFEAVDLVAKLKILGRYREEQKTLQSQIALAEKTARIAMTGSSELGIAMQFVEKSYAYHNFHDLGESLLHVCQQFELNGVLSILNDDEYLWFSIDEAIKPLEKEMIEMVDRQQRFVDFGQRTIINFSSLSLLVRNMPLDDMERYGRMKDLLPVLLSAVDSKVKAIQADIALSQQSEELMRSFGQVRSRLYYLAQTLIRNQHDSAELLHKMVIDLNTDLLRMGLEDDQEAYILHRIDSAIEDAKQQLDASATLYHSFTGILNTLKQTTENQRKLQQTFAAMNEAKVNLETEDDGSIEFF
jgi:CheY-like chemotaxis protein